MLTFTIVGAALLLGGCGSINTWLAASLADQVPQWAGGMPAEAPPRPGMPGYDDYVRKLEGPLARPRPRRAQAPQAIEISSRAVY